MPCGARGSSSPDITLHVGRRAAYWIVVEVIGIWPSFVKDVRFASLLYVVVPGPVMKGLVEWMRVGRWRHGPESELQP